MPQKIVKSKTNVNVVEIMQSKPNVVASDMVIEIKGGSFIKRLFIYDSFVL